MSPLYVHFRVTQPTGLAADWRVLLLVKLDFLCLYAQRRNTTAATVIHGGMQSVPIFSTHKSVEQAAAEYDNVRRKAGGHDWRVTYAGPPLEG